MFLHRSLDYKYMKNQKRWKNAADLLLGHSNDHTVTAKRNAAQLQKH